MLLHSRKHSTISGRDLQQGALPDKLMQHAKLFDILINLLTSVCGRILTPTALTDVLTTLILTTLT